MQDKHTNLLNNLKPQDWNTKVDDQWTVKDVIAHLVGWERESAIQLPQIWSTKNKPWFTETSNYDEFNKKSVEQFSKLTSEELLNEWETWSVKLAEESMAREVQEELQLIMKPEDFTYLCGPYGTYKFQDDIMPTLCLIYIAKLPENQTPISSDDAGKIHYFKASEIPLNQIAFDGVRTAIEFYQKSH